MVCPKGKTAFMKLLVSMVCLASAPLACSTTSDTTEACTAAACTADDCVAPCLGRVLDAITRRLAGVEVENAVLRDQTADLKESIDSLRKDVTSSWSDEVAQAACTALDANGGWMYAVRRVCGGSSARTCAQICADPALAKSDGQVNRLRCINSLHVYASTHPMARGLTPADREVLGTKVYRYNSCAVSGCGPNFCCCESY